MVRGIVDTPPVQCRQDSPVDIVSQLCHNDVYMYLAAIKTFAKFVVPCEVHVVADRLTPEDRAILKAHVRDIDIIDIAAVDTSGFPRGGTWERLLSILDLSRERYIVQLDADTITLACPQEAVDCIANNRSFTLGSYSDQDADTFLEISEQGKRAKNSDSKHVQMMSEIAFERFEDAAKLKYIRGNSAFTGFAKGGHSRKQIEAFSRKMQDLIGAEKWAEWGSEQVTSNFAIANSENPAILPFPKYGYYRPGMDCSDSVFLHFMGTYRFADGKYWNVAKEYIAKL